MNYSYLFLIVPFASFFLLAWLIINRGKKITKKYYQVFNAINNVTFYENVVCTNSTNKLEIENSKFYADIFLGENIMCVIPKNNAILQFYGFPILISSEEKFIKIDTSSANKRAWKPIKVKVSSLDSIYIDYNKIYPISIYSRLRIITTTPKQKEALSIVSKWI